MERRLLSHLLISIAVFVLTATFFMWTIDDRVLNSDVLSGEFRKAGVSQEIAKLIPDMATSEAEKSVEENLPQEVPKALVEQVSDNEEAQVKDVVRKVITADYVDAKVSSATSSIMMFIRTGEPDPVIDLSDFPSRVKEVMGAEQIDTKEIDEQFAKPIQLNENGKMDNINKGYKIFSMVKYAGLALFAVIMLLEWYVAVNGQKLKRISRVFLYAGVSYFIYWLALIFAPSRLAPVLQKNVQSKYDTTAVIDAVLKAVQGLFSSYFLGFALSCFTVAGVLYMVRHYKHRDFLPNVGKPIKSSATKK